MGKFLIYIEADNGHNIANKIQSFYPNNQHYRVADNVFWIKTDELSSDISDRLGFGDSKNNPSAGFVTRDNVTTGYYATRFWEWYNNE